MKRLRRFFHDRQANSAVYGMWYMLLFCSFFVFSCVMINIFLTYFTVMRRTQNVLNASVESNMLQRERSHGILKMDGEKAIENFFERSEAIGLHCVDDREDGFALADNREELAYCVRLTDIKVEEGNYPITDKLPTIELTGYIDISILFGASLSGGGTNLSMPFTLKSTNTRIDYNENLAGNWEWDSAYRQYMITDDNVAHVSGCSEINWTTHNFVFYSDTIESAVEKGYTRCPLCRPD